jgi:hypothetical protein
MINITPTTNNSREERKQQEKQGANKLAKFLNAKLMNECFALQKRLQRIVFLLLKPVKY